MLIWYILGLLLFAAVAYGTVRISRVSDTEDVRDHLAVPVVQGVLEDSPGRDEHGDPIGYRVRHATATSRVVVIPIMSKPYMKKSTKQLIPFNCPTCHVAHPVKCIHLWLDSDGTAIVSAGVLQDLKTAGMPDLVNEGVVRKPPPLKAGHGTSRAEIDQDNRKIIQYKMV